MRHPFQFPIHSLLLSVLLLSSCDRERNNAGQSAESDSVVIETTGVGDSSLTEQIIYPLPEHICNSSDIRTDFKGIFQQRDLTGEDKSRLWNSFWIISDSVIVESVLIDSVLHLSREKYQITHCCEEEPMNCADTATHYLVKLDLQNCYELYMLDHSKFTIRPAWNGTFFAFTRITEAKFAAITGVAKDTIVDSDDLSGTPW